MTDAKVTVERQHHVAVITLRRPDKKNALNPDLWQGLAAAVDDLAATLMASGECVHGISAFVARAEPEFPDP